MCSRIHPVLTSSLCALAFALPAAAADDAHDAHDAHATLEHARPSYQFAELRFVGAKLDDHGTTIDGTGSKFEGGVEIGERFHLFGGYEEVGYDGNVDSTELEVGAGARFGVAPRLDLFTRLGFIEDEIDHHSSDGYVAQLGVRKKLGASGEFVAAVRRLDLDGTKDTAVELGGEVHVAPRAALGIALLHSEHRTGYTLSGRYYFGGHH